MCIQQRHTHIALAKSERFPDISLCFLHLQDDPIQVAGIWLIIFVNSPLTFNVALIWFNCWNASDIRQITFYSFPSHRIPSLSLFLSVACWQLAVFRVVRKLLRWHNTITTTIIPSTICTYHAFDCTRISFQTIAHGLGTRCVRLFFALLSLLYLFLISIHLLYKWKIGIEKDWLS